MTVQYFNAITKEELYVVINPVYIPNINERISIRKDVNYVGFIETKFVIIDTVKNNTIVNIYVRMID